MALIDKQVALDALMAERKHLLANGQMVAEHILTHHGYNIIDELPTVQPKHGEWEYHSNPTIGINPETAYCSCCGFHVDTTGNIDFDEYNFCPRCGVKMEM